MNRTRRTWAWRIVGTVVLACRMCPAAETPYLYGIHDADPRPTEYLNRIKAQVSGGWVTATVAVGHNPSDTGGVDFSWYANNGHTVLCRINNGYCPDGTIPTPDQYNNFAQRCANFVQHSPGCSMWIIGNETNLSTEWPVSGGRANYVSPQSYANCFRACYNAIKAVRPNDKVISQALGPWGGPYGAGPNGCGIPSDAMPLNWVQYLNQMLTAIKNSGGIDGIALHVTSRGYNYADIHSTQQVNANGQNLYFSFYVYKDWVNLGIPSDLYHLPLYITECNGNYYWKGGHPENPSAHYVAGWMQEVYAEINRYNQQAATTGKPIVRCINPYRWCASCDAWNIDGADNPYKGQILSDLDAAVGFRYTWPTGGLDYPIPIQRGNGLANVFAKLNSGQTAKIAYIGGSITQNTGWRNNVTSWFNSKYPGRITEINAGWSGTGSLIGAMRIDRDVLAWNPDLVFIEFAVNDLPEDPLLFVTRNSEGMIRQAWTRNANADVCFIETIAYYTEQPYLNGQYPTAVQAHYNACDRYGCPSVNVGWALYEHVLAGTPWTDLAPDRVHPNAAGSQIYSDAVISYLEGERTRGGSSAPHAIPSPLTDFPVTGSTIRDMVTISPLPSGWTAHYNEFGVPGFVQSGTAGSTISVPFTGPEAAVKVLIAADSGQISYSLDGGAFAPANIPVNGYTFLWAFPAAKTASFGPHTLTLRVDSGIARVINVEAATSTSGGGPGAGETNFALNAVTTQADTYYGTGFEPARARDGLTTTKWCTTGATRTHWLAYDLGATVNVLHFVVKHAGAGGEMQAMNTKAFTIESAPGLSGPWTVEFTGSNPDQADTSTFACASARPLRYVRLNISDPGIDNYARIYEFEVWGLSEFIVESRTGGRNYANYAEVGSLSDSTAKSTAAGVTSGIGSRWGSLDRDASGVRKAVYTYTPSASGTYEVFVTWPASTNAGSSIEHIVTHAAGSTSVLRDQNNGTNPSGANSWNSLGQYQLLAGAASTVTQTNENYPQPGRIFRADAVKWQYVGASAPPPAAAFTADKTVGNAPLTVQFTDQSTGTITARQWTFGDGDQSSATSPAHTYQVPGVYSVSLTVTGPGGSDTRTKTDYITVAAVPGAQLLQNADFADGLNHWTKWTQRDTAADFTASAASGQLACTGSNYNGGVYQQFSTGGAGKVILVSGYWKSSPTLANSQWGEIVIINSTRLPADGVDETPATRADDILIFKNDTYATPGGWDGLMSATAPVANVGRFTAAGDKATIIVKSGNTGAGMTGLLADNLDVHIRRIYGDFDGDSDVDLSDFSLFQLCLNGPNQPPSANCAVDADFDGDGDADLADFSLFQHCFNGPNRAPACD